MKISRVGVDLAKNVFQVHGVDPGDHPVWQRKLARGEWIRKLTDKVEPGGIVGEHRNLWGNHLHSNWRRSVNACYRWAFPAGVNPTIKNTSKFSVLSTLSHPVIHDFQPGNVGYESVTKGHP